jgi:hypothetical protein
VDRTISSMVGLKSRLRSVPDTKYVIPLLGCRGRVSAPQRPLRRGHYPDRREDAQARTILVVPSVSPSPRSGIELTFPRAAGHCPTGTAGASTHAIGRPSTCGDFFGYCPVGTTGEKLGRNREVRGEERGGSPFPPSWPDPAPLSHLAGELVPWRTPGKREPEALALR